MGTKTLKKRKANPQNVTINIEKLSEHIIIVGDNVDVEKVKAKIAEVLSTAINSISTDYTKPQGIEEKGRVVNFNVDKIRMDDRFNPSRKSPRNRYRNIHPLRKNSNIISQEEEVARSYIKESENNSERILTVTLKIPKANREIM